MIGCGRGFEYGLWQKLLVSNFFSRLKKPDGESVPRCRSHRQERGMRPWIGLRGGPVFSARCHRIGSGSMDKILRIARTHTADTSTHKPVQISVSAWGASPLVMARLVLPPSALTTKLSLVAPARYRVLSPGCKAQWSFEVQPPGCYLQLQVLGGIRVGELLELCRFVSPATSSSYITEVYNAFICIYTFRVGRRTSLHQQSKILRNPNKKSLRCTTWILPKHTRRIRFCMAQKYGMHDAWLFLAFSDAFFRRISFGLHTHSTYIEWLVLHHHVQYRVLQPSSRLSGFGFQRSGSIPFFWPCKDTNQCRTQRLKPNRTAWFYTPTIPTIYCTTIISPTTILPSILNHSQPILFGASSTS